MASIDIHTEEQPTNVVAGRLDKNLSSLNVYEKRMCACEKLWTDNIHDACWNLIFYVTRFNLSQHIYCEILPLAVFIRWFWTKKDGWHEIKGSNLSSSAIISKVLTGSQIKRSNIIKQFVFYEMIFYFQSWFVHKWVSFPIDIVSIVSNIHLRSKSAR